jgi:hypothetical protein
MSKTEALPQVTQTAMHDFCQHAENTQDARVVYVESRWVTIEFCEHGEIYTNTYRFADDGTYRIL